MDKPLKALVFEVLLALVDEPRHGWSLVRDVQARFGDELVLPGNFYRTLRRMLADGLIEDAPPPKGGPPKGEGDRDDERRRYFRLTALGQRVARAEARRLAALVVDPRAKKLLRAR
jgi:DNA-binding PadR family transcriptional regulator